MNGYKTLEEFYRDNSSLTFLPGIETPMVFINSRDDPIVPNVILEDVRRHCSEYPVISRWCNQLSDDPIVPNVILEDVRAPHCSKYPVPVLSFPALYLSLLDVCGQSNEYQLPSGTANSSTAQ